MIRKENPPPATPAQIGGCLPETKPLVATFLGVTLVMLLWTTFPPYSSSSSSYHPNLLSRPAPSNASLPSPSSNALNYSSPPNSTADPNKRTFLAYGNAAALFVQMGAYRGGPSTFAVVGLASKPVHVFGRPWYKCEWVPTAGRPTRAKAVKMLPDWGYGRVYTVVVVNCTFPVNPNANNTGGRLVLYAFYGGSRSRYEKFTALEEAPGGFNASRYAPPYPYEYIYCGSSLYGNLSADRMREWVAYHAWFLGPNSHFVFHDAGGAGPEVRAVLEPWVRAGRVTLQDIRAQDQFDGYYYNQFLIVNDCLHRYRHSANWTFFFDVDEYLYLPDGGSLESVLRDFSGFTQFTIEQNPMSSRLCLVNHSNSESESESSARNYSREWGFEKLVFRESRTGIRRDRKYAIQAKNAFATGVHMSENVVGKTLHKTETRIRYFHYHNSITVHEELCRDLLPDSARGNVTWFDKLPYVYDDRMQKLAPIVKQFELHTLGLLPTHHNTATVQPSSSSIIN